MRAFRVPDDEEYRGSKGFTDRSAVIKNGLEVYRGSIDFGLNDGSLAVLGSTAEYEVVPNVNVGKQPNGKYLLKKVGADLKDNKRVLVHLGNAIADEEDSPQESYLTVGKTTVLGAWVTKGTMFRPDHGFSLMNIFVIMTHGSEVIFYTYDGSEKDKGDLEVTTNALKFNGQKLVLLKKSRRTNLSRVVAQKNLVQWV